MQSPTNVTGITLPEVHRMKKALDMSIPPEKKNPEIYSEQVNENGSRLGRGRAGIKCKNPNLLLTTVSASKLCKIPTVQNVTKDSMAFPVPKQLITNETATITRRKIPSENSKQSFYPDPIFRPPPRHQKIYEQIVQKASQMLSTK